MSSLEIHWPPTDPAQWLPLLAAALVGLVLLWVAFKLGAFVAKLLVGLVGLALLGVAAWWFYQHLLTGR